MNDGKKKKPQKHQNKTAFKILFNPLALDVHKKVSFVGLCKRCIDQLDWKLTFNKYKKMSEPAKCNYCHQKNIFRTYMKACESCYPKENVCPKCLQTIDPDQQLVKLNAKEQRNKNQQSQKRMNDFMKTLKERSRRTVNRLLNEKGTISWDDDLNNFVDQEDNPLVLQFRQGYGDKTSVNDQSQQDINQIDFDETDPANADWQDVQEDDEQEYDNDEDGDDLNDQDDAQESETEQAPTKDKTKKKVKARPKRSKK